MPWARETTLDFKGQSFEFLQEFPGLCPESKNDTVQSNCPVRRMRGGRDRARMSIEPQLIYGSADRKRRQNKNPEECIKIKEDRTKPENIRAESAAQREPSPDRRGRPGEPETSAQKTPV